MGGKAALLMVLGFSTIFLVFGHNFSSITTRAVDNFGDYYDSTMAYNIAISGTNLIASEFFTDQNRSDTSGTLNFQGGEISFSLATTGSLNNLREIEVTGTFNNISKRIKIVMQPSKFSRFAYYSVYEGNIWWKSQDTVWGPMHVQEDLQVSGNPVFMGKTTSRNGITYYHGPGTDNPEFNGGYDSGVDLPLPADGITYLDSLADAGGKRITNQDTVYLTFQRDSINVKYGASEPDTTYLASSYAPNGIIMANNATVRMKGTVKGQYTVSAIGTKIPAVWEERWVFSWRCWCWRKKDVLVQEEQFVNGNVFLDDDIVYEDNPLTNPNSTDMLGIVAEGDIMITDNTANNSDINIHAAIFSQNGGFGAENHDSRPVSGNIHLVGGIVQEDRRAVGTFSSVTQQNLSGFSKRYRYDDRFLLVSPPNYPGTGSFEIVSWFE